MDEDKRLSGFKATDNIATLVPTKSDDELAKEFRKKIIDAYQPILSVLAEMDKHNINMQVNVGKNGLGEFVILTMNIFKVLG